MKRSWAALAASIITIFFFVGCGNNNTSIQNPTGATLITVSPSGVIFGSSATTITVVASQFNGFLTTTVIEVNQQKIPTTYLNGTTLTGVVPATLLAKSSTLSVQTLTPQSGAGMNGLSNSLSFLVYGSPNPVPVLTSISPASAPLCTSTSNCASVNITLTGSNFLPSSANGNSKVTFTGAATNQIETAINTSSISATQITATIPGGYLKTADNNAMINVLNPPSGICLLNCPDLGGGDSLTPQKFTIGSGAAATATSAAAVAGEETPAVSRDGRYVVYAAERNQISQILFRDTCLGAEGCSPSAKTISQTLDGIDGNADSHSPAMSADGRFVAFSSAASNFVEGAPAGRQIYLHDTCIGATADCKESNALVSTDASGALTGTEAILPSISATGRFVAFVAVTKSNAVPGKAAHTAAGTANSGLRQVFVRDTCLATANCTAKTTRITTEPGDTEDMAKPAGPALSGEAKQVALANGKSATVLTTTLRVDDSVFLAATGEHK